MLHFYTLVCALEHQKNTWKIILNLFPSWWNQEILHHFSPFLSIQFPFQVPSVVSLSPFVSYSSISSLLQGTTLYQSFLCQLSFPRSKPPAGCALLTPLFLMLLHNLLSWFFLNAATLTQKICSSSWAPTALFHWTISIQYFFSKLLKRV